MVHCMLHTRLWGFRVSRDLNGSGHQSADRHELGGDCSSLGERVASVREARTSVWKAKPETSRMTREKSWDPV